MERNKYEVICTKCEEPYGSHHFNGSYCPNKGSGYSKTEQFTPPSEYAHLNFRYTTEPEPDVNPSLYIDVPTITPNTEKVPDEILALVAFSRNKDWHRHSNGGGWVYYSAKVDDSVFVNSEAAVYGLAKVKNGAELFDSCRVFKNATVDGYAKIFGKAYVGGNAVVTDHARVMGEAAVFDNAYVAGYAKIEGRSRIYANARVDGSARVSGESYIGGKAHLTNYVNVIGKTVTTSFYHVYDEASHVNSYEPKTQKAKGLYALKGNVFSTPPFEVAPISEFLEGSKNLYKLTGQFVRPCPMVPRHGFVDSRPVNTMTEAEKIVYETYKAEPNAEFIIMPFIDSKYSGIWTPGMLSVGKGNDGATTGTSARSIPTLGYPHRYENLFKSACEDAGITESPYCEILWQNGGPLSGYNTLFVQLRNGPKLPETIDYIPENFTVKNVVLAEGDLLDWETKVKEFPEGTVVYHPNGSLSSHYSVHAVLSRIPVIISHEPKVGDELRADFEKHDVSVDLIKSGFVAGCNFKFNSGERYNEYRSAALMMLLACHNTSVWLGKQDFLLGFGMGCAYRLIVTAGLGEVRHSKRRSRRPERSTVYGNVWNKVLSPSVRTRYIKALDEFQQEELWSSAFGGEKWYVFTYFAGAIYNALLDNNYKLALENLNKAVNAVHNNGWAFNKFIEQSWMDDTAVNPARTLIEVAPWVYEAVLFSESNKDLHNWFKYRTHFELEPLDERAAREEEEIEEDSGYRRSDRLIDVREVNSNYKDQVLRSITSSDYKSAEGLFAYNPNGTKEGVIGVIATKKDGTQKIFHLKINPRKQKEIEAWMKKHNYQNKFPMQKLLLSNGWAVSTQPTPGNIIGYEPDAVVVGKEPYV